MILKTSAMRLVDVAVSGAPVTVFRDFYSCRKIQKPESPAWGQSCQLRPFGYVSARWVSQARKMMSVQIVMDHCGDTRFTFDPADQAAVAEAIV